MAKDENTEKGRSPEDETDGRVLAAIGVTARAPGPRPVKRLGAAEFRANVVPAPEPR